MKKKKKDSHEHNRKKTAPSVCASHLYLLCSSSHTDKCSKTAETNRLIAVNDCIKSKRGGFYGRLARPPQSRYQRDHKGDKEVKRSQHLQETIRQAPFISSPSPPTHLRIKAKKIKILENVAENRSFALVQKYPINQKRQKVFDHF